MLFFARLLGVVEAEDVALAEYDAVAAAQAHALLHTLAVHVAQSGAHRPQLDKLVGLVAQTAMLAEYVRPDKHNVLRFERIRSADSVDLKLNDNNFEKIDANESQSNSIHLVMPSLM